MAGDVSVMGQARDVSVMLQAASQCLTLTAASRRPCQVILKKSSTLRIVANLHWQLTLEAKPVDLQLSAFVT